MYVLFVDDELRVVFLGSVEEDQRVDVYAEGGVHILHHS